MPTKPKTATRTADDLDMAHIREAAAWTADRLTSHGYARVKLAPGDLTEYKISIAAPSEEWAWDGPRTGTYFWVDLCTNFGTGYEWHGGAIDAHYAKQKWVAHRAAGGDHIALVMATFLTAVAEARRERLLDQILMFLKTEYMSIGIDGGGPSLRAKVAERFAINPQSKLIDIAVDRFPAAETTEPTNA